MNTKFISEPFVGLEDPLRFLESMRAMSESVRPEVRFWAANNLVAWKRYLGFMSDPKFFEAVQKHKESDADWGQSWSFHILIWAMQNCLGHVQGDFVECGVFKGLSMGVACDYVDFEASGRTLYLYDCFSHYTKGDLRSEIAGSSDDLKGITAKRFSGYSCVRLVDGMVPDSFAQAFPEKVAFAHIDMNEADAEKAALEALWPVLQAGAMVVLDDYGWQGLQKQTMAHNAFFNAKGVYVAELPTGQGLVLVPQDKR